MSAIGVERQDRSSLPAFTSIQRKDNQNDRSFRSSIASSSTSNKVLRARSDVSQNDDGSVSDASGGRARIRGDRPKRTSRDQAPPALNGATTPAKRASSAFLVVSSPSTSRTSHSVISQPSNKGKRREGQKQTAHREKVPFTSHASPTNIRDDSPSLTEGLHDSPHTKTEQDPWVNDRRSAERQGKPPAYGFDTDPAQIIDMALRLNEIRKRQVSDRRVNTRADKSRRVASAATARLDRSPRTHHAQRAVTENYQESPEKAHWSPQGNHSTLDEDGSDHEVLTQHENEANDASNMSISRATQNRVNKAKTYFELAYEHRRLLAYLPPLRSPDAPYDQEKPGFDSRRYNPLQYCRNRKLRFRERQPKNAEGEGWHDIQKVRAWVDAVITSNLETRHDPLECVRLPLLTSIDNAQQAEEQWKARAANNGKPRRPKSDWVTHPGDMLADQWWTEQGLNKQRIYNRDNEPIFPAGTNFIFSGWRNRTPVNVPEELKSSSPESSPNLGRQPSVPAQPALPTFESAQRDHGWRRAKFKFGHALEKRSRNTKQKDVEMFDTSSNSSSDGDRRKQSRGRQRGSKHDSRMVLSDGDPFAEPISSAVARQPPSSASKTRTSGSGLADHAHVLKHLRRSSTATKDDGNDKHKSNRPPFFDVLKFDADHSGNRNSLDYDSTAPPTPTIPSIAINLSPPVSRSPSPGTKRRSIILSAVKDKLPGAKDKVDRSDFARHSSSSRSKEHSSIRHTQAHEPSRGTSPLSKDISRDTSPFTRSTSKLEIDDAVGPASEPRSSTISRVSTGTNEFVKPHRVRGMFKGGRIAELVGNEVSRVGDFIWKREPPRRSDITTEGSVSGYESDSDDMSDQSPKPRHSPEENSRYEASPSASKSSMAKAPAQEPSQYHIKGLPSFTSPFQQDRDAQDRRRDPQSPDGALQGHDLSVNDQERDPVSTGAAAARAGKSPRFDRLALPKLNIRAATPDGRRRESYGFGAAYDLGRTRSASQLFNSTINDDSSKSQSRSGSQLPALSQYTSRSSYQLVRSISNESGHVNAKPLTVSDMLRVRAVLVAVAVKATNIADYCDAIPNVQSPFLYAVFECTKTSAAERDKHLPARRRNEHFIAGQHLITHLGDQGKVFNEKLSMFTKQTTSDFHKQIQILEDRVDKALFPRLQSLSDSVGQLAQKLTTTSTLAVKGVNDDVGDAMRLKRRGTVRFSRWFGYKMIEIGVVGALWLIWFIVTIVRYAIRSVQGCWRLIAWSLWLR